MPSLTIEAKASSVIAPAPIADETQRRFENNLVGTPGESFTETGEGAGEEEPGNPIGFMPPSQRAEIDRLLSEINTFIQNPPGNEDQAQGT